MQASCVADVEGERSLTSGLAAGLVGTVELHAHAVSVEDGERRGSRGPKRTDLEPELLSVKRYHAVQVGDGQPRHDLQKMKYE